MLLLAILIGGWAGLFLFLWQALVAVWQLELVNYVEHYGLTRKHLGQGQVRTRSTATQLERCAQGLELVADQPATPFRPSLQARPPVSTASELRR